MSFVAGAYTITYNALSLGIIEDALDLEVIFQGEDIRGDHLGDSTIDGVYRGGNCFVNMVIQEWDAAAALKAFWPWASAWGKIGTPGSLLSSKAQNLVLTKVSGNAASPTSITAGNVGGQQDPGGGAVLPFGFPIRQLLGTRLRKTPLRLQLLPYKVSTDYVWFVPVT